MASADDPGGSLCVPAAKRRILAILSNCRKAMAAKGKLLLIEDLVCSPNQPCRAKVQDITMLVRTGGRNRTEQEYRDLLAKSRFNVTLVVPAQGDLSVIEALPRS
jgi:hypothetical protein